MTEPQTPTIDRSAGSPGAALLPARPEALRLSPTDTAVVVVDMQNAYASAGGYLDLAGFDIAVRRASSAGSPRCCAPRAPPACR